jgi:hypothetical protein
MDHLILKTLAKRVRKKQPDTVADRILRTLAVRPWSRGVKGKIILLRQRMKTITGFEPSNGATYKWITGEARPTPENMERLAMVLEVDELWLSFG